MQKLFNLKFITILLLAYTIYEILILIFHPIVIKTLITYDISYIALFSIVLIAPITEEIIFRYWIYGKNLELKFGFFISFIIYLLIDMFEYYYIDIQLYNINEYIYGNVRNIMVIFLGLIVYYFIRKINFNVPLLYQKIIQSNCIFILNILIFEGIHRYTYTDNLDIFVSIFVSYIITRHARDYGMIYAILIHISYNSLASLSDTLILRNSTSGLVSDRLLYFYVLIAIICVIVYSIHILKAKPNSIKPEV